MEPLDIRNFAGVGYIQGVTVNELDKEFYTHKVKVDGMLGPNTIDGLNLLAYDFIRIKSELDFTPTYNYTNGIRLFQDWYADIYRQQANKQFGGTNMPAPETDGKWGPKTKACIDFFL